MPTDAFEMAVVHHVFRNELESAPALIGSVQPGQRRRLKLVAGHMANVIAALHHHHMVEDELLWPKLHARIPVRAEDIQRMEIEHQHIAKSVVNVELRLADSIATTGSAKAHIASQARVAQMLICEVEALAELVSDHLSAEEELL
jgi:hemerythrin-like domain-containing protein